MIIWINGSYGVGKTQVAFELHRRIKDSYVYDPEKIGFFIRKLFPSCIWDDNFQNYNLWREFNYFILKEIAINYNGVIIVPMTLIIPQYYIQIISRLRETDISVFHFVLDADKNELLKRMRRGFGRKNLWAIKQIDECINGLKNNIFGNHINTNHITISDVANLISQQCSLKLEPDNYNKLSRSLYRFIVQIKSITFE
jgi:broad-specificity NMP kinase